MPGYIGYTPTGTANSSVTDSEGSVDKKYNSGIWSFEQVLQKRLAGTWPISFRNQPASEKFTSSGTFTPDEDGYFHVLVVGGGGGGGNDEGGGGGSGYVTYALLLLSKNQTYTVTVGTGGAVATDGDQSSFDTTTANGGVKGGFGNTDGGDGGSGGGADGANGGANGSNGATAGLGGSGGTGQGTPFPGLSNFTEFTVSAGAVATGTYVNGRGGAGGSGVDVDSDGVTGSSNDLGTTPGGNGYGSGGAGGDGNTGSKLGGAGANGLVLIQSA